MLSSTNDPVAQVRSIDSGCLDIFLRQRGKCLDLSAACLETTSLRWESLYRNPYRGPPDCRATADDGNVPSSP